MVAYVCQYGLAPLGGDDWSFFSGYAICAGCAILALIVFVGGSSRYKENSTHASSGRHESKSKDKRRAGSVDGATEAEDERAADASVHQAAGDVKGASSVSDSASVDLLGVIYLAATKSCLHYYNKYAGAFCCKEGKRI